MLVITTNPIIWDLKLILFLSRIKQPTILYKYLEQDVTKLLSKYIKKVFSLTKIEMNTGVQLVVVFSQNYLEYICWEN